MFASTFGKDANPAWGDDDNSQVYFVSIPADWTDGVHLRIFDGDIGGEHDEQMRGEFNTQCTYTVYGGRNCYSNKAAQNQDPIEGYNSGTKIFEKKVGQDATLDNAWHTLVTLIPNEGEWDEELQGYVFKIVCDGTSGDDGNLYKYFVSSSPTENIPISGVNPFAYELCFRLHINLKETSHFYPFIESDVIAINFNSFDLDSAAVVKVNSIARKNVIIPASGDGSWKLAKQKISKAEKNTSMDFKIRTFKTAPNDAVVYFTNQYGDAIPFFTTPIGGLYDPGSMYKSNQKMIKGE